MRRFLIGGLIALAVLSTLGSSLGWWAQRQLVSADGFAAQTRALPGRSELHASTATALTEAVVASRSELRSAGPAIRAAVDAAVASPEFAAAQRAAYARLHRQVASASSPLTLDVGGALPFVADELRAQGHPELAVLAPPASTMVRVAVAQRQQHPLLWTALEWTAALWWLLSILAALFLGAAIFVSFRPLDVAAAGAAAVGAGAALMAIGAALASTRESGSGRIVAEQFAPSLVAQSVVLAFVAVAVAGACVLVALRTARRQARTMTEIRIADVRRVLASDPLPALPAVPEPVALPMVAEPAELTAGPLPPEGLDEMDTTVPPESELGRALADLMQSVTPSPLLAERPDRPPARETRDGDPDTNGNEPAETTPDPWTSTFLPTRGAADST